MFTFLLSLLAGAGTFYQVLERAKGIQSTGMYNHAVYSFAAVLVLTNLALAIIKHNFLGRMAARTLHGFLQMLSVSAIGYSVYNVYELFQHHGKTHVWNALLNDPLNDNLFGKAHGAAGLFVLGMLCLISLGSSLTIGMMASEKAIAANGPSHAAGGKFFFTLMCFICNFGAFLCFGDVDPIIAGGTTLVWVFAILPGKKAQVKQSTPQDKKSN